MPIERDTVDADSRAEHAATIRTIRVLGRQIRIPGRKSGRVALGIALVLGGTLGFLPVVGFWMLPLGILVLAHDFRSVRRWRRKLLLRWAGRRRKRGS